MEGDRLGAVQRACMSVVAAGADPARLKPALERLKDALRRARTGSPQSSVAFSGQNVAAPAELSVEFVCFPLLLVLAPLHSAGRAIPTEDGAQAATSQLAGAPGFCACSETALQCLLEVLKAPRVFAPAPEAGKWGEAPQRAQILEPISSRQATVLLKALLPLCTLTQTVPDCRQEIRHGALQCVQAILALLPSADSSSCACARGREDCADLCCVLRRSGASVLLGNLLSALLQVAEMEASSGGRGSRDLQRDALRALLQLIQKVSSADALAFFLPGVTSRLMKLLLATLNRPGSRAPSSGLCAVSAALALGALGALLRAVLADSLYSTALLATLHPAEGLSSAPRGMAAEEGAAGATQQSAALTPAAAVEAIRALALQRASQPGKVQEPAARALADRLAAAGPDGGADLARAEQAQPQAHVDLSLAHEGPGPDAAPGNQPGNGGGGGGTVLRVKREDLAWLQETSDKVGVLLRSALPQVQEAALDEGRVALALAHFAGGLLAVCSKTMAPSRELLLECLLSLVFSDFPDAADASRTFFVGIQFGHAEPVLPAPGLRPMLPSVHRGTERGEMEGGCRDTAREPAVLPLSELAAIVKRSGHAFPGLLRQGRHKRALLQLNILAAASAVGGPQLTEAALLRSRVLTEVLAPAVLEALAFRSGQALLVQELHPRHTASALPPQPASALTAGPAAASSTAGAGTWLPPRVLPPCSALQFCSDTPCLTALARVLRGLGLAAVHLDASAYAAPSSAVALHTLLRPFLLELSSALEDRDTPGCEDEPALRTAAGSPADLLRGPVQGHHGAWQHSILPDPEAAMSPVLRAASAAAALNEILWGAAQHNVCFWLGGPPHWGGKSLPRVGQGACLCLEEGQGAEAQHWDFLQALQLPAWNHAYASSALGTGQSDDGKELAGKGIDFSGPNAPETSGSGSCSRFWPGSNGIAGARLGPAVLEGVLRDACDPSLWHSAQGTEVGRRGHVKERQLLQQVLLEAFVVLALHFTGGAGAPSVSARKRAEGVFLRQALGPVLSALGSGDEHVAGVAQWSIFRIASIFGFPSVDALVLGSADLILTCASSGLRHLALHPEAPYVLLALLGRLQGAGEGPAVDALLPALVDPVRVVCARTGPLQRRYYLEHMGLFTKVLRTFCQLMASLAEAFANRMVRAAAGAQAALAEERRTWAYSRTSVIVEEGDTPDPFPQVPMGHESSDDEGDDGTPHPWGNSSPGAEAAPQPDAGLASAAPEVLRKGAAQAGVKRGCEAWSVRGALAEEQEVVRRIGLVAPVLALCFEACGALAVYPDLGIRVDALQAIQSAAMALGRVDAAQRQRQRMREALVALVDRRRRRSIHPARYRRRKRGEQDEALPQDGEGLAGDGVEGGGRCREWAEDERALLEQQDAEKAHGKEREEHNWLMPRVHLVWPHVLACLKDASPLTIAPALDSLEAFIEHSDEGFSARKIREEAWPVLAAHLLLLSPPQRDPGPGQWRDSLASDLALLAAQAKGAHPLPHGSGRPKPDLSPLLTARPRDRAGAQILDPSGLASAGPTRSSELLELEARPGEVLALAKSPAGRVALELLRPRQPGPSLGAPGSAHTRGPWKSAGISVQDRTRVAQAILRWGCRVLASPKGVQVLRPVAPALAASSLTVLLGPAGAGARKGVGPAGVRAKGLVGMGVGEADAAGLRKAAWDAAAAAAQAEPAAVGALLGHIQSGTQVKPKAARPLVAEVGSPLGTEFEGRTTAEAASASEDNVLADDLLRTDTCSKHAVLQGPGKEDYDTYRVVVLEQLRAVVRRSTSAKSG